MLDADNYFRQHPVILHPTSTVMQRAKKNLGQNFLVDESVAARIVREVAPQADETLIEIGAGRGALTARLLEHGTQVVAIEFDRDLVPHLRERFGARQNFSLVEGDALALDYCTLIAPAACARVVANLPYNISTAILQRLIEQRHCLTDLVLMLQREVVARMVAPPETSERGFLSVLVEAYFETETLFDVAPIAFRPVPKVWSTVVRLRIRQQPHNFNEVDETTLWRIVGAGFAQRRKTIFNNLRHAPADLQTRIESAGGAGTLLQMVNIDPQRRAETLSLEEWMRLVRAVVAKR